MGFDTFINRLATCTKVTHSHKLVTFEALVLHFIRGCRSKVPDECPSQLNSQALTPFRKLHAHGCFTVYDKMKAALGYFVESYGGKRSSWPLAMCRSFD